MSDTSTAMEHWLVNTTDTGREEMRVGMQVGSERIPRQQLRMLSKTESKSKQFELIQSIDTTDRYQCRIKDDTPSIAEFQQHRIEVAPEEFSQKGELIIETTGNADPPRSSIDSISVDFLLDIQKGVQKGIASPRSLRVAGAEAEKQQLQNFLTEQLSDWGLREETGILLQGPPGTGKTELVKSVCEELYGTVPEMIEGPEVMSRWVGGSEATLRRTFKRARESTVPVLYIDEIDAIGASRANSTQDHTAQIVSQLLVLLDGIGTKDRREEQEANLKVIASTNAPDTLDPALTRPGRLGDGIVKFDPPDENGRIAIFHHYFERIHNKARALSDEIVPIIKGDIGGFPESFVEKTEGYTGSDIERVILLAARRAMRSDSKLEFGDVEAALEDTKDELPTKPISTASP